MKLSVSLPADIVEFLDEYATTHAYPSRSAVVLEAIRGLRHGELDEAYGAAWSDWDEQGEARAWESTASDGV